LTVTNITSTTANTNQGAPTDWVPLCYKFRGVDSICQTYITETFVFDTHMTTACITNFSSNKATAMCTR
jgi:hypothetical protein